MDKIDVIVNNRTIHLTDKDYLAQGGEGKIFVKNSAVYKIAHDAARVLPDKKIQELQSLRHIDNIIIPNTSIFDPKGNRIGYVMRYITDTEPLCKLSSKNFKDDNNISVQMVSDIIKKMQETVIDIHKAGIVIGDLNEMNFLVDDTFKIPYFIDTDSYQTPSYKCTAIMDSVRDRKYPFGEFHKESDWFSFAIVTFNMMCGIHPFRGKHPNFKNTDFDGRMKAGITVYDKDVSIPKFVDLSVIPAKLSDWYKDVFIKGDRSIPPFFEATGNVMVIRNVYTDANSAIISNRVFKYDTKIVYAVEHGFNVYVITQSGLFRDNSELTSFATDLHSKAYLGFTDTSVPVIGIVGKNKIDFYDQAKNQIGTYETTGTMACNDCMYSVSEAGIIEHSFEVIGKVKVFHKVVATAHPLTTKMYEGIAIHDLYTKKTVSVPYAKGLCVNVHVPELNPYRIIDAKRIGHVIVVIGENLGKYDCITLLLDKKKFDTYTVLIENDVEYRAANFMVKDTGLVVKAEYDNSVKFFANFDKAQIIPNTPIDETFRMFGKSSVYFINHNEIHMAKSK